MKQRFQIIFAGRVQGVGFRVTTRAIARNFAVTGWVRNERDGTVCCVVEGERQELDAFVEQIKQKMERNIERIEIEKSNATGETHDFTIQR